EGPVAEALRHLFQEAFLVQLLRPAEQSGPGGGEEVVEERTGERRAEPGGCLVVVELVRVGEGRSELRDDDGAGGEVGEAGGVAHATGPNMPRRCRRRQRGNLSLHHSGGGRNLGGCERSPGCCRRPRCCCRAPRPWRRTRASSPRTACSSGPA